MRKGAMTFGLAWIKDGAAIMTMPLVNIFFAFSGYTHAVVIYLCLLVEYIQRWRQGCKDAVDNFNEQVSQLLTCFSKEI